MPAKVEVHGKGYPVDVQLSIHLRTDGKSLDILKLTDFIRELEGLGEVSLSGTMLIQSFADLWPGPDAIRRVHEYDRELGARLSVLQDVLAGVLSRIEELTKEKKEKK